MKSRRFLEFVVATAIVGGVVARVALNPISAVWGLPRIQHKGWVLCWHDGLVTTREGNQVPWCLPGVLNEPTGPTHEAGMFLKMQQGVLAYRSTEYIVVASAGQTPAIRAYALPPEALNAMDDLSVTQDGMLIDLGAPFSPDGVLYLNRRTGEVSRVRDALWAIGDPTHREIVVQLSRRHFEVWSGPAVRRVLASFDTCDNVTGWDYSFDRNRLLTLEGGEAPRTLRLYRPGGNQVWSRHLGILMIPRSPSFQGGAIWVPVDITTDVGFPVLEFSLDGVFRGCPCVDSRADSPRSQLIFSSDLTLLSRVTSMASIPPPALKSGVQVPVGANDPVQVRAPIRHTSRSGSGLEIPHRHNAPHS